MTDSNTILEGLERDGILKVVPTDGEFDRLVQRLGGTVFHRTISETSILTTYRWANTQLAAEDADTLRKLANDSGNRGAGAVGGHGPNWLILLVDYQRPRD